MKKESVLPFASYEHGVDYLSSMSLGVTPQKEHLHLLKTKRDSVITDNSWKMTAPIMVDHYRE